MKNRIYAFTLIFALAASSPCVSMVPAAPARQHEQKTLYDRISTPLIVAILGAALWATASDDVKEAIKKQIDPKSLAFNFVHQYSSWTFTALMHEVGHAQAELALTGQRNTVHLGATEDNRLKEPLFRFGHINIEGFAPDVGYVQQTGTTNAAQAALINTFVAQYCVDHRINRARITPDQIKDMLKSPEGIAFRKTLLPPAGKYAGILLAGGISGLLAHHLSKAGHAYIRNLLNSQKDPLRKAARHMLQPDSITVNQIFSALIPCDAHSDGAKLWRDCVGVPESVVNAIIKIAVLIDIAGEVYLAHRDPEATADAHLHSKALIGLINFFARGYFHFHA